MTCKNCIHLDVCHPTYLYLPPEKPCKNFKDKSRIIDLPCKVGDKVYEVAKSHNCTACFENGYDCERSPMCSYTYRIRERKIDHLQSFLYIKNDGEVVLQQDYFLTREEAEKALAERREQK